MGQEGSFEAIRQSHFLEQVDKVSPERIVLLGERTPADVLGEDFFPTIVFLRRAYINSDVVLDDNILQIAIDWADIHGSLFENDVSIEEVPPEVALHFETIFFRDLFKTSRLMNNHSDLPIAHMPSTKVWEQELRIVTRERITRFKFISGVGRITEEMRGSTTEILMLVPQLLHQPQSLSPDDNFKAQDLLTADLFKTYWTFLGRKAQELVSL